MLVSLTEDRPAVKDAVMTVLMASMAVLAFGALGLVIFFTLARGWHALIHLNTYTQDLSSAGPLAPLTKGGIGHAIVGTLWMIGIAVVLTVPARAGGRRLPRHDPQPSRPGLPDHRRGHVGPAEHPGRSVHLCGCGS